METRINITPVGLQTPLEPGHRSYGPPACAREITVLNGFARHFSTCEARGAFSLKWIPRGAARYAVDRVEHKLTGDKVLLLHPGQPYEIEFLDRNGTESFCLFFSEPLLEEALASLDTDIEAAAPST